MDSALMAVLKQSLFLVKTSINNYVLDHTQWLSTGTVVVMDP